MLLPTAQGSDGGRVAQQEHLTIHGAGQPVFGGNPEGANVVLCEQRTRLLPMMRRALAIVMMLAGPFVLGSFVAAQDTQLASQTMPLDELRLVAFPEPEERLRREALEEDKPTNYGPPASQRRGTLMQWSYGTSFSGGPDVDAPLVTDRPSFTSASSTVGRNVLQIETGYLYTTNLSGSVRTTQQAVPETLVRLGMFADWFELRLGQNLAGQDDGVLTDFGADDMFLGGSIALTGQEGILPEMALLPGINIPTGKSTIGSGELLPSLVLSYAWELSDRWSMGGCSIWAQDLDGDSNRSYVSTAQSWYAGLAVTEKTSVFAEFYGLFPVSAESVDPQYYFDSGLAYLITDNIQWDWRAGMGLNQPADDFFTGTGLSIRFR